MSATKTPFLFITHRFGPRYESELCAALLATGRFDIEYVSKTDRNQVGESLRRLTGRFSDYSAVVTFINFSLLREISPIPWGGYAGRRVMYDADAVQSFSPIVSERHLGQYPIEFVRHRYDEFIATGKLTTMLLNEAGVPARWLPKAYDSTAIRADMSSPRDQAAVHVGSLYPARQAMLTALRRCRCPVVAERCSYEDLNGVLNRHSAALICNMEGYPRPRRLPWRIALSAPRQLISVRSGLEPMAKNFEAAAAGCAVFMDYIEELEELGFVDGHNCVFYRDFQELADQLLDLDSERMRLIGERAADLCEGRHSWRVRAGQMADLLDDQSARYVTRS